MRSLVSLSVLACLLSLSGCGGDDGNNADTLVNPTFDASSGEGSSGDGDGDGSSGDGDGTSGDGDGDGDGTSGDGDGDGAPGPLDPPAGMSSGGAGGGPAAGSTQMAGNITYRLITGTGNAPYPLLVVYSGVEGGALMTQNLMMVKDFVGASNFVIAVLDGVTYNGNGQAGATVIDDVRARYDIDNDRTYLLSESAGTTAGLQLGLDLRQSYFAAYWANDVNASGSPTQTAAQLGFQPFGNAGPGGDFVDANAIVGAMQAADYRTPPPAPYDGPGSGTHGDPNQFIAAMQWFPGKSRQ